MKLVLIVAATLLLTTGATASTHRPHGFAVLINSRAAPVVIRTRPVPASANATTYISFNGHHDYRSCWPDSPNQVECGWHGVIAVVTAPRHGPTVIQVASVRSQKLVTVRVRFAW